jgi:WD40 repeat protein
MGADQIVSASTDNTLKLWDVKRMAMLNSEVGTGKR